MALKDPEAQKERKKEYMKEYREANKEKIKEYNKQYRQNNKEKKKEYNEQNKEKIKEQSKKYNQTEKGQKSHRISHWKRSGVKSDNFDELHEKFITTKNCERCNVELVGGGIAENKRCLHRDKITGQFISVLCNTCNVPSLRKKL